MQIFVAAFAVATIFSVFLFLTLKQDIEEKSQRPLFLLFFALIGWASTMPALIAPNLATTSYQAYNIISSNQTYVFPAYNVTSSSNNPFPISTFYSYLTFWSTIMMVHFLVLIFYLIGWFKERAKQGFENIPGG